MKKALAPLLIILIAFIVRVWHYEYFPIGGETADEAAWTMLGASLIQERVPASWSYFSAYEKYHYQEGQYDAPVVRPVLDHPPLFSLLPGLAQTLKGHWLDYPSLKVIRLPLVLLGTLNVALFWLVAKKIFVKRNWALLATLLFATIPSVVFSSRLVVAENLLVTWILLVLTLSLSPPSRKIGWALIAVSAAAVLTKMAGVIVPVSLIVGGLAMKKRELVRFGVIGGLIGLGLFALYGAVYNWQLFTAVFLTQSTRELGLATLQNRLFMHPTLVKHVFFDGWKLAGFFATVYLLGKSASDKKFLLVHVFTLISLLFIALTTGESTFHGWYDVMLWPTLVLALAGMLQTVFETGSTLMFGALWLLLLPTLRLALVAIDQYTGLSNLMMRGIMAVGFLPFAWQAMGYKRQLKITMAGLLLILIVANVVPVFSLTHETYWLQAAFFEIW